MHQRPTAVPAALLSLLCLTGCAGGPPAAPRVEVVRMTVPAALLSCQPAPVPPAMADDRDLARYILALSDAGDDCRDRLSRVRELSP